MRPMTFALRLSLILAALLTAGAMLYFRPETDLRVATYFFDGHKFPWRSNGLFEFIHEALIPLAAIAALLFVLAIRTSRRRVEGKFFHLSPRAWLFLLLTLAVGPGLVTNLILKDNWDRARPIQIAEFGGSKLFTPPLVISNQCERNCSFVSGDAAFAFWLHSFAYVTPRRRRKVILMTGLAAGAGIGFMRILMGAHFLSDVFFAGFFTLLTSAAVYAGVYGRAALASRWREWLAPQTLAPSPAASNPAVS